MESALHICSINILALKIAKTSFKLCKEDINEKLHTIDVFFICQLFREIRTCIHIYFN